MYSLSNLSLCIFCIWSITQPENPVLYTKTAVHCRSSRLPKNDLTKGHHRPQLTLEVVVVVVGFSCKLLIMEITNNNNNNNGAHQRPERSHDTD